MPLKIYTSILLTGLLLFVGCSKSKYDDFVEVNTEYINAMDTYTNDLDQAKNADDMAKAIDQFAEKMDKLVPRMKALRDKYPEWSDETKVPEELKPLAEKAEEVARRLPQSFMRTMKYMQDPKVAAAMQRMQESMAKMQ